MNFGEATKALKNGKRVARAGWNGKDMWLRLFNPFYDSEFRMSELPNSQGTWMPFVFIKTPDNKLYPWNASQADALAEDWEVVEYIPPGIGGR